MGWIIAGLIVAAILTGICVYAYYYNNVWHPDFGLPNIHESRKKIWAERRAAELITWINPEGITKQIYLSNLGHTYGFGQEAFDVKQKRCLICDSQRGLLLVVPEGQPTNSPLMRCQACVDAFWRAAEAEFHNRQRVFPGHDIDDIMDPYRTWRCYARILRQMDDGMLSDEEGHEQIDALLNKRSRAASAARQAIAQAATAQSIAIESAAAERQLQRLAARGRRL